jgi:hypothetical protein
MKKLGLLAVVLGLVLAFAMPASAIKIDGGKGETLYVGGVGLLDFGAWNRTKERLSQSSDRTELLLNVPQNSQFRGYVTNGPAGLYWEFGLGTAAGYPTGTASNTVENRRLYGYYKSGNCELRFGKDDGWIWSAVDPAQALGLINAAVGGTVRGFGWGSFYDGRYAQVAFLQTVNKQFNYRISLVAPPQATDTVLTKTSFAQMPILAAKGDFTLSMIRFFPAAAIMQVKFDQVASGVDDTVTSYYLTLPVRATFGAFVATGSIGFGQNTANMLAAPINGAQIYRRTAGGSVKNTGQLNGFVDLAYTFGAVTPHVYFGYDKATNSDFYTSGENSNVRQMYGVSLHWVVTPNFTVKPEFTYFDFGKSQGSSSMDLGKDWYGGVQFAFVF